MFEGVKMGCTEKWKQRTESSWGTRGNIRGEQLLYFPMLLEAVWPSKGRGGAGHAHLGEGTK